MRVAIVGAGIAGLTAASRLAGDHDVVLFEGDDRLGGHARTVELEVGGRRLPVDTGFVVYNEATYPELTRLFVRHGVGTVPSDMSFSVRNEATGLEYCGTSLATLFAQPRNALRPAFLGMLREIVRFNREAPRRAESQPRATLGELLDDGGFGRAFREDYLLPMAAAVWSSTPRQILATPASFLVRFFANHGFLTADGHFSWRTVAGGSVRYVEAIGRALGDRVRLASPVERVERRPDGVWVRPAGGPEERFDEAVLAVHSDQALAMLARPTAAEREVLGAIPFQRNDGLVHTDLALLPRARRARASWNYHVAGGEARRVALTYDMSRLQGHPVGRGGERALLTLNRPQRVDPRKVLAEVSWEHPVFTPAAVAAQGRHGEVSGADRVHYCGAYWRNGFHEDGVVSALAVCHAFENRRGALRQGVHRAG